MSDLQGKTVLVVNDTPAQLTLQKHVLEGLKAMVVTFRRAEAALGYLADAPTPDLIITDLHMPGMDGWELCHRLRDPEDSRFAQVPLLVVSATYEGEAVRQSALDLGADAFLSVPFESEKLREVVRDLLTNGHRRGPRSVLIVEDDGTLADVLRGEFEEAGYQATAAASLAEGRYRFVESPPDIVVLDQSLPDGDGETLAAEFRQARPQAVIAVMTGLPDSALPQESLQHGADAFVSKPFEFAYLLELCERALRQRHLERAKALLTQRTRELRESEERFGTLFEALPETVIVHADDGTILHVNRAGASRLGWTPGELEGKPLSTLLAPESADRVSDQVRLTREEGVTRFETQHVTRTGQRLDAEVTQCRLVYEGRSALLSVARDITERKAAQRALERENAFSKAIVDRAGEGICVCHEIAEFPFVRFTVWNQQMTELTGYTMAEINRLGWYQSVYPDQEVRERAIERMARMRLGEDLVDEEWVLTRADDRQRLVTISTRLLTTETGVSHVLAVMHDMTDERELTEQLRRREEAERAFGDRLTALHEVTNALSRTESLDSLCRRAIELGHSRLGFERLGLWFVTPNSDRATGTYGIDETGQLRDERDREVRFHPGSAMARVIVEGKGRHFTEAPLFNHEGKHVGAGHHALMPVEDGETIIGVLTADTLLSGRSLDDHDLEVLRLYASALGHLCALKRAEDALRQSERQYRLLAENVADVLWTGDLELRSTYFSPSVERLLGYRPEELLGLQPEEFLSPDAAAAIRSVLADELAVADTPDRPPYRSLELELQPREGGTVPVEIHGSFLRDENQEPVGVLCVVRDIRARRAAQRAQALERQRLSATLRSLPESVAVVAADGKLVLINPACETLTGWSTEAAQGKSVDELAEVLGAGSSEELLTPTGAGTANELVRPGPPRQILEVGACQVVEGPEAGGHVLLIRDVTRDREVQQQVTRHAQLASVGQLAAGIAHDFNNLLMGITGFAEILQLRDDLPASVKSRIRTIEDQGRRGAQLVKQILDFSRQTQHHRTPLVLAGFLRDALALLERTLEENVVVSLQVEAEDLVVDGDAGQLRQVLTNLAVNARDLMPQGGQLRLALSQYQLAPGSTPPVAGMEPGLWAKVTVTDTGPGMSAETARRCFEPFFTTKEVGRGSGLGLAQAYGLVKQQGGHILVEATSPEGTTFALYLPARSTTDAAPSSEPEAPSPAADSGQTVLVVEDDPRVRAVLEAMLDGLGYAVLTAADGEEALELYTQQANQIDVILSDKTMPGLGGLELCRRLRQTHPDVKIVIITGYLPREGTPTQFEPGIVGWIQKPPSLTDLSTALRQALQ